MKGSTEIITMLNELLAEEHSTYVQYTTHARITNAFGYKKLAEYLSERANDEKEHAIKLIDRILYLEGVPLFAEIGPVFVGNSVLEQFPIDKESELNLIAGYTEGIMLAMKLADLGTMCLLQCILQEEEKHLGDIESNIAQITQAGIENYLVVQI